MPDHLPSTQPLWDYSLRLYPEIKSWCLDMQDHHGANVNMLLFCCLVGNRGVCLSQQQVVELQNHIIYWDDNLAQPLRQLRRELSATALGDSYPVARQLLLDAELNAERHNQQLLWQWWQQQSTFDSGNNTSTVTSNSTAAISANLNSYAQQLGASVVPKKVIKLAQQAF